MFGLDFRAFLPFAPQDGFESLPDRLARGVQGGLIDRFAHGDLYRTVGQRLQYPFAPMVGPAPAHHAGAIPDPIGVADGGRSVGVAQTQGDPVAAWLDGDRFGIDLFPLPQGDVASRRIVLPARKTPGLHLLEQIPVKKDLLDHGVVGELLFPGTAGRVDLPGLLASTKGEHVLAGAHAVECFQGFPAFAALAKEGDVVAGAQAVEFVGSGDGLPFAGVSGELNLSRRLASRSVVCLAKSLRFPYKGVVPSSASSEASRLRLKLPKAESQGAPLQKSSSMAVCLFPSVASLVPGIQKKPRWRCQFRCSMGIVQKERDR